eukprot:Nitzschia sp. Nitz4//scaffold165_size50357//898//1404//NITZ4_007012-RA/size50357-processed-gene-0.42-mRNA-1//1//CDS//3329538105//7717//frame0
MSFSQNTPSTESFYIPIDLESSLGRIENDPAGDDGMDCETVTNTSEHSPFATSGQMQEDHHVITPYPIEGSKCEARERHRLTESVGKLLPPPPPLSGKQVDWVPEDIEPVEDPGDDDYSLSSESLEEGDVELEGFDDPVSFFESAVASHPPAIPQAITYTSCDDASMS